MQQSGLNSNEKRRAFWEWLCRETSPDERSRALASIAPLSAKVIYWHYQEGKSFIEIKELLGRSISMVRHYHNRGFFELQQYFNKYIFLYQIEF